MVPNTRGRLPDDVVVQPGLDVDELWSRFELFEALHHNTAIASPMADGDLDRVVELLNPAAGARMLDLACGYGELLKRLSRHGRLGGGVFEGVGVDLSPWMVAAAARQQEPGLRWVLAEARSLLADSTGDLVEGPWDMVCCLGASWIWYGLHGTIRAVADLAESGAMVAIGDMHVRPECDVATVGQSHGRVDSLDEISQWFDRYEIDVVGRVPTSDIDWNDYLDRVEEAAETWSTDREPWVNEARQWRLDAARDQAVFTWSVWVGRKR